jgi:hypothetical protein
MEAVQDIKLEPFQEQRNEYQKNKIMRWKQIAGIPILDTSVEA